VPDREEDGKGEVIALDFGDAGAFNAAAA